MHVSPATERFRSVHALGQALWTFASSRGQVEWKNYYFHTPPAFDEETLRGIPHAPVPAVPGMSLAEGVPVALATVERTAILADSVNMAPPHSETASPQLFLSTKLAKPTPSTGPQTPPPAEEPAGNGSWRRWAAFGVVAAVVSVGLGIGYRQLGAAPASPSGAPASTPAADLVAKLAPATASPIVPVSKRLPAPTPPVARDRAPLPNPSAQTPVAMAPPKAQEPRAQKKTRPVRPIHAPPADQPPKLTGLDKNGIGIPSN